VNLIQRDMDIITNAMVNNDLGTIQQLKSLLRTVDATSMPKELHAYAAANTPRIIRPTTPLNVDIQSFSTRDIRDMIEQGKKAAQTAH